MSFGKRLKCAREDKGLTQKELADLLFLGESTISFYEADKREPKFEILQKISEILGVTTDYLLGRPEVKTECEPTEVELEAFLENAKVNLGGKVLPENLKKTLLQVAKVAIEEQQKLQDKQKK